MPIPGDSGNRAFGSLEPIDAGFFIDRAWRFCWPNVIARAWQYQQKTPDLASKIESGGVIESPNDSDNWYMDLLSQDPTRTQKALEEEGMLFLASQDAIPEEWEKWVYTRMVVRASNQPTSIQVKAASRENKQGLDSSNARNSIGHFLVLTLPPKPENPRYFAKALSDYKATNKVYPLA